MLCLAAAGLEDFEDKVQERLRLLIEGKAERKFQRSMRKKSDAKGQSATPLTQPQKMGSIHDIQSKSDDIIDKKDFIKFFTQVSQTRMR